MQYVCKNERLESFEPLKNCLLIFLHSLVKALLMAGMLLTFICLLLCSWVLLQEHVNGVHMLMDNQSTL